MLDPRLHDPEHPEFDPFGPDAPIPKAKPRHGFRRRQSTAQDLLSVAGGQDPEKTGVDPRGGKRKPPPDHHQRSEKWLADHGHLSVKTEWWCSRPDGFQWKRDLFGFADRLSWKNGVTFAIQIKDGWHNLNDALRDMCSDKEVTGQPYRTKIENLRAWLRSGNRVLVMLWEKGERFYEVKVVEVTEATILEVESRRRRR